MHTDSLSEASEEPRNAFDRLRRPHGDHVISRNVVRPTSLSLDMQGNHVIMACIKWPCGERARPQIDHKLQQRAQICCEKFKCIIMTMICAGVCAVRRGIDAKTKNSLHTQGLEVFKSVNKVCIASWLRGPGKRLTAQQWAKWIHSGEPAAVYQIFLRVISWCNKNNNKNMFLL